MRGPYKFEKLASYPHLVKAEAAIWERFIEHNPGLFQEVWYDVQVGDCRPCEEKLNEKTSANRLYLGKYKIDVLAIKDGVCYIVEIKKEATTKALGEVWLYEHLFKKENPTKNVGDPIILTDVEMPNVREVCESDGVMLAIA